MKMMNPIMIRSKYKSSIQEFLGDIKQTIETGKRPESRLTL